MSRRYLTRAEQLRILLSLTDAEALTLPVRVAALAEKHDDLGAGMCGALAEIAESREQERSA